MTYELVFHPTAMTEWKKLDGSLRNQFKKKLEECLQNPHIPAARLSGQKARYKIRLRDAGYRLVYEVHDNALLIMVISVGKRERNEAYKAAAQREFI
jgi:mRNA interferase RelE/StbE